MKKSFYFGVVLIVILILALLSYGLYLNQRSENNITQRMAERRLPLNGTRVKTRNIFPMFQLEIINLYSNEMVDATALIDGKVNSFFVSQNSLVNVGDSIVELFNEDIPLQIKQAESDILQAQANFTRAESTFKRYSELVTMDAISRQKFDEAEADYKSALAMLENARAKRAQLDIRQDRQIVTAPINGEILRLYKQIGTYVTAGTPLALIGNFDTLFFETELFSHVNDKFEVGQTVELHFSESETFSKAYGANYSAGNEGRKQVFKATLIEISPPFSQPAAMRKLIWKIDNSVGLLEPGMYDDAQIHFKKPLPCLVIPEYATVDDKDNFVFVVNDGVLKLQEIVTGLTDGKYMQVVSGLNEGDIVITSYTAGLTEGLPVEVFIEEDN